MKNSQTDENSLQGWRYRIVYVALSFSNILGRNLYFPGWVDGGKLTLNKVAQNSTWLGNFCNAMANYANSSKTQRPDSEKLKH